MTQTAEEHAEALQQLKSLFDSSECVHLATQSEAGPAASYATFVVSEEVLYVLISRLAEHTQNLQRCPAVSVMLLDDQANCRNPFARNRLTLECVAEEVGHEAAVYESVMQQYRQRHGSTVDLLRRLPDFMLFRLRPQRGRLVIGFGRAYRVQMPGFQLQPITAAE
ncbi:pyridoxamine 5'-phosphate oxidase family protein [Amphritea sp. 1_MG-2023]|uniref:HugZ family pyridoxamine 5'-phosphate oxidase n=1 Tax=Amphritea sp. 1_MG-2023 TaxID=3062670 RepID=UPI0026E46E6E|nr:pyridoxamine 5'-phosphate oxidase family protein [Amphritea sp. 1_MG-2023]MDO6562936.1 pyridoxamine 5'-phosphate oxidase family protein [Amphritea sp. 1_MG-2023]